MTGSQFPIPASRGGCRQNFKANEMSLWNSQGPLKSTSSLQNPSRCSRNPSLPRTPQDYLWLRGQFLKKAMLNKKINFIGGISSMSQCLFSFHIQLFLPLCRDWDYKLAFPLQQWNWFDLKILRINHLTQKYLYDMEMIPVSGRYSFLMNAFFLKL